MVHWSVFVYIQNTAGGEKLQGRRGGRRNSSTRLQARPTEAIREMRLDRRPLAIQDAVHAGVAQSAVGGNLMLAQYPIQFRAEPQDGSPALLIEETGSKFTATQRSCSNAYVKSSSLHSVFKAVR